MSPRADDVYWKQCWPESLLPTIKNFLDKSDTQGLLGISSLAVCNQRNVDCEAAISTLLHETLQKYTEAKNIRKDLAKRGLELKEMHLYEIKENTASLYEKGLVPLSHLDSVLIGYRKSAREIYRDMASVGIIKIENHSLTDKGKSLPWVGLNTAWDEIIEEIESTGTSTHSFISSLGVMLCMAINRSGKSTVLPMARGILIADNNGGQINYPELTYIYRNQKSLNIALERDRERVEEIRIFASDDGQKLIINRNAAYAVGMWLTEANKVAQNIGLGVR